MIELRRDSIPLRLPNIFPPNLSPLCLHTALPALLTEQAGGEVGWANVCKRKGGAVRSLANIFIFFANNKVHLFFFVYLQTKKAQKLIVL